MSASQQVPVTQGAAASRPLGTMFGSLQREIDRLFEDFSPTFLGREGAPEVRCRMNLAETREGLELTVEVPGMEEDDVQVSISDGQLIVSGEKKFEKEEKDKNYRFVERGYGAFSRSIDLPPGVKAEGIQASLAKGVLKITVPAPAKPEAKKIEVKSAG